MKTLLACFAVVVILGIIVVAVTGSLRVRNTDDEVNVTIDKSELKTKTEQAVNKAKQLGERAVERTREAISKSEPDESVQPSSTSGHPGNTGRSQTGQVPRH